MIGRFDLHPVGRAGQIRFAVTEVWCWALVCELTLEETSTSVRGRDAVAPCWCTRAMVESTDNRQSIWPAASASAWIAAMIAS